MNLMKDLWKKQYKNILLVLGYIVVACIVYGVWVHSVWKLWYVDFIVILAILAIGITIGYFYIKSELKNEKNNIEIKQ